MYCTSYLLVIMLVCVEFYTNCNNYICVVRGKWTHIPVRNWINTNHTHKHQNNLWNENCKPLLQLKLRFQPNLSNWIIYFWLQQCSKNLIPKQLVNFMIYCTSCNIHVAFKSYFADIMLLPYVLSCLHFVIYSTVCVKDLLHSWIKFILL